MHVQTCDIWHDSFLLGDQDAGFGRDPLRLTLDALSHFSAGQFLPGRGLPGHLGAAFLPPLYLFEQRHQPCHLQCHVPEVPRGFQKAVSLRPSAHEETRPIQCRAHLQRHQGDVQRGKSQPLHDRNGRAKHSKWPATAAVRMQRHLKHTSISHLISICGNKSEISCHRSNIL